MINTDMRSYNYYTLGALDAYGQPALSGEPVGTVKMAINISAQAITDNVLYKDAKYIGLTMDAKVNDTYVIDYDGAEKLKVLYINPKGRYKQVFLNSYE
jgi:hypothetical protein